MIKSWMWENDASGGVSGVQIDTEEQRIQWFEEPGCACAGSASEQSIADFLEHGARFLVPPDDILQAMRAVLTSQTL